MLLLPQASIGDDDDDAFAAAAAAVAAKSERCRDGDSERPTMVESIILRKQNANGTIYVYHTHILFVSSFDINSE